MKIYHRQTNELIAEGRRGWAITPFEGNFYISGKSLRTNGFRLNFIPGLCIYKFVYVWLDFHSTNGEVIRNLGWKYWFSQSVTAVHMVSNSGARESSGTRLRG